MFVDHAYDECHNYDGQNTQSHAACNVRQILNVRHLMSNFASNQNYTCITGNTAPTGTKENDIFSLLKMTNLI